MDQNAYQKYAWEQESQQGGWSSIINNNDGTRSYIEILSLDMQTGQPVYKVTNLNSRVVSFVKQTGVAASGQPIYTVSNQYGTTNFLAG